MRSPRDRPHKENHEQLRPKDRIESIVSRGSYDILMDDATDVKGELHHGKNDVGFRKTREHTRSN